MNVGSDQEFVMLISTWVTAMQESLVQGVTNAKSLYSPREFYGNFYSTNDSGYNPGLRR